MKTEIELLEQKLKAAFDDNNQYWLFLRNENIRMLKEMGNNINTTYMENATTNNQTAKRTNQK